MGTPRRRRSISAAEVSPFVGGRRRQTPISAIAASSASDVGGVVSQEADSMLKAQLHDLAPGLAVVVFITDEDQQGLGDRAGQRREGRDGLDIHLRRMDQSEAGDDQGLLRQLESGADRPALLGGRIQRGGPERDDGQSCRAWAGNRLRTCSTHQGECTITAVACSKIRPLR